MFEKFGNCRSKLDKQYACAAEMINEEQSKALYNEMKNIYFGAESLQLGKGKAVKHYFENTQLFINPYDIFGDLADFKRTLLNIREEQQAAVDCIEPHIQDLFDEGAMWAGVDFGHTSPDWNRIFEIGFHGIIADAEKKLENPSLKDYERNFYISVKEAYEGILIYINRLAEMAGSVLSENAHFAASNLKKLAADKPSNLAEAMQLYFIYYAAQHWVEGVNVRTLGAVDKLLYPFYKADKENGTFNEEEIRELVRYFLFKWNSMEIEANIPFNLCEEVNELTYIILEEYIQLNIPDPKIHIKCSDKLPQKVYDLIMDSIRNGNNSFVFINSEAVYKALMNVGIEEEDAKNYTVVGCYEPSADGTEIPCTLNGRISMPMAVESVLNNGKRFRSNVVIGEDFGDDFADFNSFYAAVKKQLSLWSETALKRISELEGKYPLMNQAPIFSATYKSCFETATDAYSGGAKYNNSSVCAFGAGTLTDELIAIKKAVFDEKIITLKELVKVLKNNWQGNETLRKIMMDKYPKYGNNDSEADEITVDIEKHMAECINNKANGRGGVFRLGYFSIDWIVDYGRLLGASADGRYAGEPVSKNISASVGMDKKGVTGIIKSASKLDYSLISNGTVLDIAIHPTAVSGEEGLNILTNILKLYFAEGGFAMHINVLDPNTLRKAQENPEKYKNLQVRLCGWNVYFTDLDKIMQDNLIKSMED